MKDRVRDPAIEAARRARSAERSLMAMATGAVGTEFTPEFRRAEQHWQAADEAFADSIPTSAEGAMLKLDAVIDLIRGSGADDTSLEIRHLRALRSYLSAPADLNPPQPFVPSPARL